MPFKVSETEFNEIVGQSMDELAEQMSEVKNIVFTVEDLPTPEQRQKLKLMPGHSLFGLYEGIPLTQRYNNYSMVLPDKITIFKQPLEYFANSFVELNYQVKRTVWHEIAHHYGLSHKDMENRIK